MSGAVFSARGVTKAFPGVHALDRRLADLSARSIHALLGENGAGKSTLIKIITGRAPARRAARWSWMDGRQSRSHSTREAIARRHRRGPPGAQPHPALLVGENILLERLRARPLPADRLRRGPPRGAEAGSTCSTRRSTPARGRRTPQRRADAARRDRQGPVAPGRGSCCSTSPPRRSPSTRPTTLFAILRRLRDDGAAIVFVSHKLEEVFEICDRVTVLRDGRNACESRTDGGAGPAGHRDA